MSGAFRMSKGLAGRKVAGSGAGLRVATSCDMLDCGFVVSGDYAGVAGGGEVLERKANSRPKREHNILKLYEL